MFAMSDGFAGVVLQPTSDTSNAEASSKDVAAVERKLDPLGFS
jgi:hypothetical protein